MKNFSRSYFKVQARPAAQGALLIEVLMAVAILATALLMILKAMAGALRASTYTSDYAVAAFLLEEKIAEGMMSPEAAAAVDEDGSFEEPFDKYTYRIQVHKLPEEIENLAPLTQMDLQIQWPSRSASKGLAVSTFLPIPGATQKAPPDE